MKKELQKILVVDTGVQYDTGALRISLFDFLVSNTEAKLAYEKSNQISFRGINDSGDFTSGVGSLYSEEEGAFVQDTRDFKHTHPDTPVKFQEILSYVSVEAMSRGLGIGRMRVMRQSPKTCLSLHSDPDPLRFHIPLYTNQNAIFLGGQSSDSLSGMRMPVPGHLYTLKTDWKHTIMNAHRDQARVHMVFDTYFL